MDDFNNKLSEALESEDDWRKEYVFTTDLGAFKILAKNEDEAYRSSQTRRNTKARKDGFNHISK
jgi:hypothetical protein